jgi:hypothetical protein
MHLHATFSESSLPLNYIVEYSMHEYRVKKMARML